VGFRSLQARTATLVSGSIALQLFDRVFYPGSDLDLYVHPDHQREVARYFMDQEGYTFSPGSRQSDDFDKEVRHDSMALVPPEGWRTDTDEETDEFHKHIYRFKGLVSTTHATTLLIGCSGIGNVFTFIKPTSKERLKVQVLVSKRCPLECILEFHSSRSSLVLLQFLTLMKPQRVS
jgi:hypothetical protein